MKCILMGLQDMKFKLNGDEIDGVKLHFTNVDPNVNGRAAVNQFVKRHVFDSFGVSTRDLEGLFGVEVDIDFNNKGKIVGFAV